MAKRAESADWQDNDQAPRRPGDSAFSVLMRTGDGGHGRGETVRSSAKYPLILQVRTVEAQVVQMNARSKHSQR